MDQISLRPVTPADESFLRAVYASTRAAELEPVDWTAEQKALFCNMQFTAQDEHYRGHFPSAEFFVIERAGVDLGRLYVDRWKAEIRIMDIALLPEYCGQGLGTRLLGTLMQEAKDGGKTLSIHVEKFNPALRLYHRLGFQPVEDKGVYLLMEWGRAPEGACQAAGPS